MKDEEFWKDVAKNTLAGVFTLSIAWLFGVVFGYFASPAWTENSVEVLGWAALAIWVMLMFINVAAFFDHRGKSRYDVKMRRALAVVFVMNAIFFSGLIWALITTFNARAG